LIKQARIQESNAMFSDLMISTIHAPLLCGLGLGLFALFRQRPAQILVVATVLLLAVYVWLEGLPTFPPVASKQKLVYLLLLAGLVAFATPRRFLPILTAGFLILAAVWLGWAKISQGGLFAIAPVLAPVLAPIMAATVASRSLTKADTGNFLGPLALLVFAIGGAVLSLLGVFVGFAQVSGACAAFVGGVLVVLYAAMLTGRDVSLGAPATVFLLLALTSVVILIGLFAPEINVLALIILAATLVMPAFVPLFSRLPVFLRPVMQGAATAVPAACAVALAYLQP
jgi:hypothetical protein